MLISVVILWEKTVHMLNLALVLQSQSNSHSPIQSETYTCQLM